MSGIVTKHDEPEWTNQENDLISDETNGFELKVNLDITWLDLGILMD